MNGISGQLSNEILLRLKSSFYKTIMELIILYGFDILYRVSGSGL